MLRPNFKFRPRLSQLPRPKKKFFIGLATVAFLIFLLILWKNSLSSSTGILRSGDSRVEIKEAKKTMEVNQEFNFPLKNDKGDEISNIKFAIERAELRDEIIVKGKRATSVKGRTFLIINLKIVNDFKQSIEIKTRDYIRLAVNGNEKEWLAPDIHNDPVEIQPISTKYTRVGFPINDTDRKLKLQIGEVNGEKKIIDLIFN